MENLVEREADDIIDIKQSARERLSRIKVYDSILPTARRMARGDPELITLSRRLADDGAAAIDDYARQLGRVGPPGFEMPEGLFADPVVNRQLAEFARAGLLFFDAGADFTSLPLGDRRAAGGSGSVNRTARIGDRLLLETSRVVVQFADGTDEADRKEIRRRHDLIRIKQLDFAPLGEIAAVVRGQTAIGVSHALMEEDSVVFAEPDFVENVGQRSLNDPQLSKQWHLHNSGQPGADISAFGAWTMSTGVGVKLAVIDNGFDPTHVDLQYGNGSGWYRATADMLDADFVQGLSGMPTRDHGTACAGMAAASGGNGFGGAGVAYGAELTAIACLSDQIGTQSTLARALGYAVKPSLELDGLPEDRGADVVVCSLGPSSDASWSMSQTLRLAIDFVTTSGRGGKGAPLFWACTNGNHPIASDEVCSYPPVVAVGRSTNQDEDDGSGFGRELAFLAPGVDVYLPTAPNTFAMANGTSYAAPCAAGVGALVLAASDWLTARQVRAVIEQTCDKVGALPYVGARNDRFGHGRVNAMAAVAAALTLPRPPP